SRAEDGLLATQRLLSQLGDLVAETLKPVARVDEVDSLLRRAENVIGAAQRHDLRIAVPYAGVLITRAEMKLEAGHLNEMRALADRAIAVLAEANRSVPEVQSLLGRADG